MANELSTHEVFNQPPPLDEIDLYACDAALGEAVAREGAVHAVPRLASFGRLMGSREAFGRPGPRLRRRAQLPLRPPARSGWRARPRERAQPAEAGPTDASSMACLISARPFGPMPSMASMASSPVASRS